MESYVVRIYRRDEQDPQKIVGLVEMVESAGKEAFEDFDELRSILSKAGRNSSRKKGTKRRENNSAEALSKAGHVKA